MWFERFVTFLLGATVALVVAVWASIGWLIGLLAVAHLLAVTVAISRHNHRKKKSTPTAH